MSVIENVHKTFHFIYHIFHADFDDEFRINRLQIAYTKKKQNQLFTKFNKGIQCI